jgi:hypothetical protein
MKHRTAELVMLAALSAACSGDGRAKEQSAATQPSCSSSSLRGLLPTDSSTLRRVDRTTSPGQSTEGAETAVFYAGPTPRLIRATFYGEMGRARELYYLLDSLSFVRVRAEDRYTKPITVERNPSISSTASDTVWICAGRAQAGADSAVVQDALATVRQVLRAP